MASSRFDIKKGLDLPIAGAPAQEIEDAESDWYTNPADGVSFGASLDLSRFIGTKLTVDYSMLPMGDFGTNSVVAFRVAF